MTAEALIRTARSYLGHREVKPNSSPLIDHWLQRVGQPPGMPWCAAYVCACLAETEPNLPFRKSAGAMRILTRNPDRLITYPEPGGLVVWDHNHSPDHAKLPDHSGCKGHVAIVTGVGLPDGMFSAIAGNTSFDGKSREGVMVAEHAFTPKDPTIAGYMRLCKPPVLAA